MKLLLLLAISAIAAGCSIANLQPEPTRVSVYQLSNAPTVFDGAIVAVDACLFSDMHDSVLFNCSRDLSKPMIGVLIDNAILRGDVRTAYANSFKLPGRTVRATFIGRFKAVDRALVLQSINGLTVSEP